MTILIDSLFATVVLLLAVSYLVSIFAALVWINDHAPRRKMSLSCLVIFFWLWGLMAIVAGLN